MTKESRLNLIFLTVLLVVLTPGAVILFRKKLEPTVRPMYLPDPVPRAVAYLAKQAGTTIISRLRARNWFSYCPDHWR